MIIHSINHIFLRKWSDNPLQAKMADRRRKCRKIVTFLCQKTAFPPLKSKPPWKI